MDTSILKNIFKSKNTCADNEPFLDKEFNKLDLLNKLNELKSRSDVELIVKGSKLGQTAYLKPIGGIPFSDLSVELLNLINTQGNTVPSEDTPVIPLYNETTKAFGKVVYDPDTNSLLFYAQNDDELSNVLGSVVLPSYEVEEKEEVDPTVPQHVKNITQDDINKWNQEPNISVRFENDNLIFN